MGGGAAVIAEIKEGHAQSNDIWEDCMSLRILQKERVMRVGTFVIAVLCALTFNGTHLKNYRGSDLTF